jgi:hypothetical protein
MKYIGDTQKTQATSAMFSNEDNWLFYFFHSNAKGPADAPHTGIGPTN